MHSVIICACREEQTIARAIGSFKGAGEIIVVAPDAKTLDAAREAGAKAIRDSGKGKPAALNLAVKHAKGDILVLSDGDVYTENYEALLQPFIDPSVGAVTGRPVSRERRSSMLGYWSLLLVSAAHRARLGGKEVDCSGYLFAIRNSLMPDLPHDLLADDAFISQAVRKQGYVILYEPSAKAFVRYPSTFSDWVAQKKRSAGGYVQLKERGMESGFRSFRKEAGGIWFVFRYPGSFKEIVWSSLLVLSRIYLWIVIFINIKLLKKPSNKIWVRTETTKV